MKNLRLFFLGLSFLLRSIGFRSSNSYSVEEENLPSKLVPEKLYRVKYFFTKRKTKNIPPTILLTHGMSGFGIEDKRITDVAASLASCGYNIVLPEFDEIKALKISPESIQNFKDVFLILLESEKLNVHSIGFFSVSFSAGFGLVSFSDPIIAQKVKSILAVGGFAELMETSRFAISNYLIDDYPSNILFYNYITKIMDDSAELKEVFYQAALDNGLRRKEEEKIAPILYQKLSKEHKEFFDKIKEDENFRKSTSDSIIEANSISAKSISPYYFIEKIKAPISLIHGKADNVIPETESLKLSTKMKEFGLNFRLEITGLLSHGDKVPIWKQIAGLPGLSSAFGYFFDNLNEKK